MNMFLQKEDLPSTMYGYQLEQITEGNDIIVDEALAAAEEEVRSYLTGNNRREWLDGRLQYDVDVILGTTGTERNALIKKHAITIAKWWIIDLANADIIYEQAKERYDRSVEWLDKLSKGEVTISTLPQIDVELTETQPFSFGSNRKFNHSH